MLNRLSHHHSRPLALDRREITVRSHNKRHHILRRAPGGGLERPNTTDILVTCRQLE